MAATDELCLKEIKISRILPSEKLCLKLRADVMLRYLHTKIKKTSLFSNLLATNEAISLLHVFLESNVSEKLIKS